MKRFVMCCLTVLFLFAGALPAPAAYLEEYKLDLVPNQHTAWGKGAQFFCDLVKERSNGKINIRPYFNSQLTAGKQTSSMQMLRNGSFEFAFQSLGNWSPQMPEANLCMLPFFINTYAEVEAVQKGKASKVLDATLAKHGIKFLAWGENGYRAISNSKRDIKTVADLKGLKIRVGGSAVLLETMRTLGANATIMNWSDVMTAIQQGVIDGQENPLNYIYAFRVNDYHKHMTDWRYVNDWLWFTANQKVWNSFSPDDQKLIQQAAEDAGKYQVALARMGLDDGWAIDYLKSIGRDADIMDYGKLFKDNGVTLLTLTPEALAEFTEKARPVFTTWREKIGPELVDLAIEDMKTVRK